MSYLIAPGDKVTLKKKSHVSMTGNNSKSCNSGQELATYFFKIVLNYIKT